MRLERALVNLEIKVLTKTMRFHLTKTEGSAPVRSMARWRSQEPRWERQKEKLEEPWVICCTISRLLMDFCSCLFSACC